MKKSVEQLRKEKIQLETIMHRLNLLRQMGRDREFLDNQRQPIVKLLLDAEMYGNLWHTVVMAYLSRVEVLLDAAEKEQRDGSEPPVCC